MLHPANETSEKWGSLHREKNKKGSSLDGGEPYENWGVPRRSETK
jgi:hypothetical protein